MEGTTLQTPSFPSFNIPITFRPTAKTFIMHFQFQIIPYFYEYNVVSLFVSSQKSIVYLETNKFIVRLSPTTKLDWGLDFYNPLTHNVEVYGIGSGYSGWNLAFINARVPLLHIFDDQGPFVCSGIVSGQESLISGISILAHSQNVNVSMADPCDLKIGV